MNRNGTIYIILFLGIAIWLVCEHRARVEQGRQIAALRQQLGEMTDRVTAADERVSNVVVQARQLQVQRTEQAKEFVQLRDEVKVLHQQTTEIEALEASRAGTTGSDPNSQVSRQSVAASGGTNPKSSRLQILAAYYWAPDRAIDVTKQLQEKIVGDKLEVIARNDLRGDPEYGQPKTLTVLYSFDGVTMTNEVREGGLMMIPEGY